MAKPPSPPPPLSDEELQAELIRREIERRKVRNDKIAKGTEFVLQHVDQLLELCPDHDRTSCSDSKVCNHGPAEGCRRCQLLWLKEMGFNSDNVVLDLQLHCEETSSTDPRDFSVSIAEIERERRY